MDGFTPPTVGVFDAPTVSVSLNVEWRGFILGVLEDLITPCPFSIGNTDVYLRHSDPIWSGDDDSQFLTDQEIEKLISALASGQGLVMIPTGITVAYAGTVAPDGWLVCDGSEHLKADYPELWGVLSLHEAYESEGDTFKTPDLRSRVIVGAGHGIGLSEWLIGNADGQESITLDYSNIPSHHQAATAAFDPGEESREIEFFTGDTNPPEPPFSPFSGYAEPAPFTNMQPSHSLNFIIKT